MPVIFMWWWVAGRVGWGLGARCWSTYAYTTLQGTVGNVWCHHTVHYHMGGKMFVAFNEMGY